MKPMLHGASKTIALYAFATLLVSGSNFLIVPLLLRALGPERFSTWAILEPVLLLLVPVSALGIHIGLLKVLTLQKNAASFVASVLPYHILFAALAGLAGMVVLLFLIESKELAVLAGVLIFLDSTILFFISYWRALNQPVRFAAVEGGRALFVLGIVTALAWAGQGMLTEVSQYLYVRIVLALLAVLFALGVTRPQFSPSITVTKRAIKYGLPIVLAGMVVAFMSNFDRFAVLWAEDRVAVAYYVAHVKVVQILGSTLVPFFIWFAPVAIRKVDEGSAANSFFAEVFFGFVTVNVALSAGLWLILPSVWPHLFPGVVLDLHLMSWLLLGMAVFACGNPLSISTLREGKTHHSLLISIAAIGVGTVLVLTLALPYGATGVAIGKFGAMTAYTLLFGLISVRALGISYPWIRIGLLVGLGVFLATLLPRIIDLDNFWLGLPTASLAALFLIATGYGLSKFSRTPVTGLSE